MKLRKNFIIFIICLYGAHCKPYPANAIDKSTNKDKQVVSHFRSILFHMKQLKILLGIDFDYDSLEDTSKNESIQVTELIYEASDKNSTTEASTNATTYRSSSTNSIETTHQTSDTFSPFTEQPPFPKHRTSLFEALTLAIKNFNGSKIRVENYTEQINEYKMPNTSHINSEIIDATKQYFTLTSDIAGNDVGTTSTIAIYRSDSNETDLSTVPSSTPFEMQKNYSVLKQNNINLPVSGNTSVTTLYTELPTITKNISSPSMNEINNINTFSTTEAYVETTQEIDTAVANEMTPEPKIVTANAIKQSDSSDSSTKDDSMDSFSELLGILETWYSQVWGESIDANTTVSNKSETNNTSPNVKLENELHISELERNLTYKLNSFNKSEPLPTSLTANGTQQPSTFLTTVDTQPVPTSATIFATPPLTITTPPLTTDETPPLTITTPPLTTDETQALTTATTPPLTTDEMQALTTDETPPLTITTPPLTTDEKPPLTMTTPPLTTDEASPLTITTPPLTTDETPPLTTDETQALTTATTPPLTTDETPPLTITTPPLTTDETPPLTITTPPLTTDETQALTTATTPPLTTDKTQALTTSLTRDKTQLPSTSLTIGDIETQSTKSPKSFRIAWEAMKQNSTTNIVTVNEVEQRNSNNFSVEDDFMNSLNEHLQTLEIWYNEIWGSAINVSSTVSDKFQSTPLPTSQITFNTQLLSTSLTREIQSTPTPELTRSTQNKETSEPNNIPNILSETKQSNSSFNNDSMTSFNELLETLETLYDQIWGSAINVSSTVRNKFDSLNAGDRTVANNASLNVSSESELLTSEIKTNLTNSSYTLNIFDESSPVPPILKINETQLLSSSLTSNETLSLPTSQAVNVTQILDTSLTTVDTKTSTHAQKSFLDTQNSDAPKLNNETKILSVNDVKQSNSSSKDDLMDSFNELLETLVTLYDQIWGSAINVSTTVSDEFESLNETVRTVETNRSLDTRFVSDPSISRIETNITPVLDTQYTEAPTPNNATTILANNEIHQSNSSNEDDFMEILNQLLEILENWDAQKWGSSINTSASDEFESLNETVRTVESNRSLDTRLHADLSVSKIETNIAAVLDTQYTEVPTPDNATTILAINEINQSNSSNEDDFMEILNQLLEILENWDAQKLEGSSNASTTVSDKYEFTALPTSQTTNNTQILSASLTTEMKLTPSLKLSPPTQNKEAPKPNNISNVLTEMKHINSTNSSNIDDLMNDLNELLDTLEISSSLQFDSSVNDSTTVSDKFESYYTVESNGYLNARSVTEVSDSRIETNLTKSSTTQNLFNESQPPSTSGVVDQTEPQLTSRITINTHTSPTFSPTTFQTTRSTEAPKSSVGTKISTVNEMEPSNTFNSSLEDDLIISLNELQQTLDTLYFEQWESSINVNTTKSNKLEHVNLSDHTIVHNVSLNDKLVSKPTSAPSYLVTKSGETTQNSEFKQKTPSTTEKPTLNTQTDENKMLVPNFSEMLLTVQNRETSTTEPNISERTESTVWQEVTSENVFGSETVDRSNGSRFETKSKDLQVTKTQRLDTGSLYSVESILKNLTNDFEAEDTDDSLFDLLENAFEFEYYEDDTSEYSDSESMEDIMKMLSDPSLDLDWNDLGVETKECIKGRKEVSAVIKVAESTPTMVTLIWDEQCENQTTTKVHVDIYGKSLNGITDIYFLSKNKGENCDSREGAWMLGTVDIERFSGSADLDVQDFSLTDLPGHIIIVHSLASNKSQCGSLGSEI